MSGASRSHDRPLLSLGWMTGSAVGFSIMAALVKRLSSSVPHFEIVFFRCLINLLVVGLLMARSRERFFPPGRTLLVFRGLAGFGGVACMFYAIARLPLPIAMMLSWLSPIFVILISAIFLGERVRPASFGWIALAFAGLVLLLDPRFSAAPLAPFAVGVGIAAAAFGGMAYVAVRAATNRVGVHVIVFYFVAIATVLSAPLAAMGFVVPDLAGALELMAAGLCATAAQYAMTQGYRHAPAGIVSMMNLLNPMLAALIGWLVFGELLAGPQWGGMALLMGSIAALTWSSARAAAVLPARQP